MKSVNACVKIFFIEEKCMISVSTIRQMYFLSPVLIGLISNMKPLVNHTSMHGATAE